MSDTIDKQDLAEAIAEAIDDKRHEVIGYTLAASDSVEWGTLVVQTWPDGDDKPSVDFLVRVTRYRQPRSADPSFCPRLSPGDDETCTHTPACPTGSEGRVHDV